MEVKVNAKSASLSQKCRLLQKCPVVTKVPLLLQKCLLSSQKCPLLQKCPLSLQKCDTVLQSAPMTLQKCPTLQMFPTFVTKVPYRVTKVPFLGYKSARASGSLPPSLFLPLFYSSSSVFDLFLCFFCSIPSSYCLRFLVSIITIFPFTFPFPHLWTITVYFQLGSSIKYRQE